MAFYPLEVVAVERETAEASSFVLCPEPRHAARFAYLPGQFLTFRVALEGRVRERCYSLSSEPGADPLPRVTVKRVAGGRVSNWFNDRVSVGDVLQVAPPSGRFVLRDPIRPLTFFAGGSGITPILSLIKQGLRETGQALRLFYANASREQAIFGGLLDEMAARSPERLGCHHHVDSERGLAKAEHLRAFLDGRHEGTFYICGPGPFMDLAEEVLRHDGVSEARILIERFSSPDDPTSDVAPASPEAPSGIERFRARLDGEAHEVPYLSGETLLECLLQAGLDPPHSCQDAHCGSCMVLKTSGEVALRKSSILSKRDKERGYILLCQAIPLTDDVEVDCDS